MAGTNGNNRSIRLIVVEKDKSAREYVKRSLAEKGVRVIGEADDITAGLRLVRGLQPDMVLLEIPVNATETVNAVEKIKEELPDTGIILSAHQPSPQLILSFMRAGGQEFVGHPIDAPELEKAIEHVYKMMERTGTTNKNRGQVLSVFSCKGGLGCTSVVANLGVALASRPRTNAVIVDLSFQMGDLGLMLDLPPKYSLMDAFHEGKLDETKLRSVLSMHPSGAQVLTVAPSPEIAEDITRDHMVELFGTLNTMFDFIIVDVGRQLDDRTAEVLDLSDMILLVSSQDIPTIRNVNRFMDILGQMGLERRKFRLLVNRFHKKSRLSLSDIETALDMETFWAVPNDFEPMSLGIDSGNPAVLEAPRSKVAQSFFDLAESLCQSEDDHLSSEPLEATTN